ncbi:MAG: type B diterpene cyclase [Anaerolineae bacterium]
MNLHQEIYDLLQEIGPGRMRPTAYDTAWVARLAEIDEPIGKKALDWIRAHQLEDGSWGAEQPYYHHDRVICTLAAMSTLSRQGERQDHVRLKRAVSALKYATTGLDSDPAETIGFELIAPTLWSEVERIDGVNEQGNSILEQLAPRRSAKLSALPKNVVDRTVTVAFSSEMAGFDGQHLLNVENLQEVNGSVGTSPSATAYFALYVRRGESRALNYLREVAIDGTAPNVMPFEVFEIGWTLWNLMLTDMLDDELLNLCKIHLDTLEAAWKPGQGVGHTASYTLAEGDDTSLTYEVLAHFGRTVDLEAVLNYEHVFYFRCFELESNPSISTNIHVLGALRQAGLEKQHPSVQKVLRFLEKVRTGKTFWFDKWHTSPYYATAHGIIACAGYADELVHNAVSWILDTQNEDGSWGYYMPSAEETAYCLQSLAVWKRQGYDVPNGILERGAEWLAQHAEPPYPPLWIGKCLYCPELVIRSAILSALALVAKE